MQVVLPQHCYVEICHHPVIFHSCVGYVILICQVCYSAGQLTVLTSDRPICQPGQLGGHYLQICYNFVLMSRPVGQLTEVLLITCISFKMSCNLNFIF